MILFIYFCLRASYGSCKLTDLDRRKFSWVFLCQTTVLHRRCFINCLSWTCWMIETLVYCTRGKEVRNVVTWFASYREKCWPKTIICGLFQETQLEKKKWRPHTACSGPVHTRCGGSYWAAIQPSPTSRPGIMPRLLPGRFTPFTFQRCATQPIKCKKWKRMRYWE